ncbi:MAG: radical SAM protein [bacterium]
MKQESRETFYRQYSDAARPLRVQIETTRRCNLDCVHCALGGNHVMAGEMGARDYEKLIPQLRAAGVFNVYLTGGEFLAHPEIDEILNLFLEADFWLSLQTNGVLLNSGHVDLFLRHPGKVRSVTISLYGATAEVHESVTRSPGSFEKTLNAISMLLAAGIRVEVITLLMTLNHHEREAIERMCADWDVKHQFNSVLVPCKDGSPDPLRYRLPDELIRDLPRPWETFTYNFTDGDPADFKSENTIEAWCSMARSTGYLDSNGNLLPCSVLNIPAGNVRETPFGEIWSDSPVFKRIRELKISEFECSGCRHFPTCKPCPGLAYIEHGDMFAAPREICRIVEMFLGKKEENHEGKEALLETSAY